MENSISRELTFSKLSKNSRNRNILESSRKETLSTGIKDCNNFAFNINNSHYSPIYLKKINKNQKYSHKIKITVDSHKTVRWVYVAAVINHMNRKK